MALPLVPTDRADDQGRHHRTQIATAINEVIRAGARYPVITDAERAAGVTEIDDRYPPLDLRRYGAAEVYDAAVDDLEFWETALSVIEEMPNASGTITGAVRMYRINGTLSIYLNAGVAFGINSSGIPTNGWSLFSETDAPILVFEGDPTATDTRFMNWENFTVCGTSVKATTGSAKTSQDGVVVNNRGVHLRNVAIRACGGNGFVGLDSNSAQYENIYTSLCDGHGYEIDFASSGNSGATWGHNTWINCTAAANAGDGFHVTSADGRDKLFSCDFEQNEGMGRYFGEDVIGFKEIGGHSELNVTGTIHWDTDSNDNEIDLIWGDSGGVDLVPVNDGGIGNHWSGQKYASGGGGFNTRIVGPKLIDYSEVTYAAYASSAGVNAIPLDNTKPQASGEGVTRMTLNHLPKAIGTCIEIECVVCMSISAGNYAISSGFNGIVSATDAVAVALQKTAVDVIETFPMYFEKYTTTSLSNISINVNIGADAVADVRFNGVSADIFSTIPKSFIRLKEYWAK